MTLENNEVASPQLEKGHTKIANEILDALCRIRISGEARQVLDFIIRKTYGWHKKSDTISLSQFTQGTNLIKPNICRAINKLIKMRLIVIKKDNNKLITYCFNKHYDTWKPLSKKITPNKPLSKKIISVIKKDNLALSKKIPTKETNTKETNTKETSCSDKENSERAQDSKEPPKKEKKPILKFSDDDMKLAILLDNLIINNNPNHKISSPGILGGWANQCRLMRERDGRKNIESVLRWSQNDPFWMLNILSMATLRKQYEKLEMKKGDILNQDTENELPEPDTGDFKWGT